MLRMLSHHAVLIEELKDQLQASMLNVEKYQQQCDHYQKESRIHQQEADIWKDKYHHLLEQLALAKQQRFAPSSERDPAQGDLFFNEAEAAKPQETDTTVTVAEHTRKSKPKRASLPDHLPREVIECDIAEQEKRCACGCMKERFGEEVTEQLCVIPAQIKVIQYVRPKYACKVCEQGVSIAPMSKLLLPKSMASSSLVAYTITSKYVDHLPLYRQEAIWQRYGVTIPRNTSCDWLMKTAGICMPLLDHLKHDILHAPYIQADETTAQVLKEPNRSNQQKSYVWVYQGNAPNNKIILYDYQETRAGKHAENFLETYKGYLQTDGYAGYHWVDNKKDIIHLGCMAHARRPFMKLMKLAKKTGKSYQIVALIKKLYLIEKITRDKRLSHAERFMLRLEKSKPLLDKIKDWLDKAVTTTPPKGALGKAIRYMLDRWDQLCAFLQHGMLEIDNNGAENAIRPFALGRKNWLFAASPRGAKASMLFYSLIMTCKANDIEPFAYFNVMLKQIPHCKTQEDYKALLPYNIAEFKSST